MGGGVSKSERKKKEQDRHELIKSVERFVINVYATCPRMESMRLILSSVMAYRAFHNFVLSEKAEENLKLYTTVTELRKKKSTPYQLSKEAEKIYEAHIQTDTPLQVMVSNALCDDFVRCMSTDRDEPSFLTTLDLLFDRLLEESLFLMARDQFHRFILSKYYKTWRAAESSHAIATTTEDHSLNKNQKKASEISVSVLHSVSGGNKRKSTKSEDLSVRAFQNVDANEIAKILGSENWLTVLLAAVEALPICFALATARRDRRGFPLMYVNKYFEKVTGFSRSDVLGKNCRFLQCYESEKSSVSAMGEALRACQSTQVIITNQRADRKIFKNVVALKPLFNETKKKLLYVMSIQIDVSREVDDCVSKLRLASDLMEMLPDIIIDEDEDIKSGCLA